MKKLTKEQKRNIANRYESRESAAALAVAYGVCPQTIYNVLKALQVSPRYRYDVNETFFDSIDSEASAYWLGFLFADGWIYRKSPVIQVGLELHIRDVGHLEKYRLALSSTHPISYRSNRPMCRVTISSPALVSALEKHGMTQRKSLALKFPITVPAHLIRHFIRGCFDGDGCIKVASSPAWNGLRQPQISFYGTNSMTNDIRKHFSTLPEIGHPKIYRQGHLLAYGGAGQVPLLLKYLYEDSAIWLDRKHGLALSVIDEFRK